MVLTVLLLSALAGAAILLEKLIVPRFGVGGVRSTTKREARLVLPKFISFPMLLGILIPGYADALSQTVSQYAHNNLQLQQLIEEALKNNPRLNAGRLKASSAKAASRGARFLEAPEIDVELREAPARSFPDLADRMETDYYFKQMIPFPGKLSTMAKAEKSRAGMFAEESKGLERKVISDVKKAYYELYFLHRRNEINERNKESFRDILAVARIQYETGMGKFSDVLRAETELANFSSESLKITSERKGMEAMLNSLLNRPVERGIGVIDSVETPVVNLSYEDLRKEAEETKPEIIAMSYNVKMGKYDLSAARREFLPDFMVGAMVMDPKEGDKTWSAMLGMNLPIAPWSYPKYRSNAKKAEHSLKQAEYDYAAMKSMVFADIQTTLSQMKSNQDIVALHAKSILPRAQENYAAVMSSYKTGKTEFIMLIDALQMLTMARMNYYMAIMNLLSSQAELEQAVGVSLREMQARKS